MYNKTGWLGLLSYIAIALVSIQGCSKGSTGATGANGTANVQYSSWAALAMTYSAADSAYKETIAADSVSQAVLDSGIVLCYIKYTNTAGQLQVENASVYIEIVLGVKTITLYSYTYNYTGVNFRYVIIPGGTKINGRTIADATTIQGYTKAQWQAMPYDSVMKLIGKQ
jgi:hypothetical protein